MGQSGKGWSYMKKGRCVSLWADTQVRPYSISKFSNHSIFKFFKPSFNNRNHLPGQQVLSYRLVLLWELTK